MFFTTTLDIFLKVAILLAALTFCNTATESSISKCRKNHFFKKLDCGGLNLTAIELQEIFESIPTDKHFTTIILSGNNLPIITEELFSSHLASNVTKIFMTDCSVQSITNNVFAKTAATEIWLSKNALTSIGENVFHGTMDTLVLSSNNLSNVSIKDITITKSLQLSRNILRESTLTFENVTINLLDLSYNKLKHLTLKSIFKRHCQVSILNLSHNFIVSMGYSEFKQLTGLSELSLAYNLLREAAYANLDGLQELKGLNLSGNQLGYYRPSALYPLRKLQWLDLSETGDTFGRAHLKHIPALRHIGLQNNSYDCDTLYDLMQGHMVFINTQIVTPRHDVQNIHGIACFNNRTKP